MRRSLTSGSSPRAPGHTAARFSRCWGISPSWRCSIRSLHWCDLYTACFLGMMLALDVFAVAAIRSDAYFGIHERPVASIVLFAFVAVLNLGVAIARFAAGEPLLENGLLTRESSMNLILGIAFVPVTAASIVSAVRARREDT